MKAAPKSCNCKQCRASKVRKFIRSIEERHFRREAKAALKRGAEVFIPAPYGDYLS